MPIANLPAICVYRPAWNKGRIVGQKRPLPKRPLATSQNFEDPNDCRANRMTVARTEFPFRQIMGRFMSRSPIAISMTIQGRTASSPDARPAACTWFSNSPDLLRS
jgi:hypothetical protein